MTPIIEKLINEGPIRAWDCNDKPGNIISFYTPYLGHAGPRCHPMVIIEYMHSRFGEITWIAGYAWDLNKIDGYDLYGNLE